MTGSNWPTVVTLVAMAAVGTIATTGVATVFSALLGISFELALLLLLVAAVSVLLITGSVWCHAMRTRVEALERRSRAAG